MPGSNANEIAGEIGVTYRTATHRFRRMKRRELLLSRQLPGDRETVWFAREDADLAAADDLIYLFGSSVARDVAVLLNRNKSATASDVAAKLGVAPSTARRHLRTFYARGLVDRSKPERSFVYMPLPRLVNWVKRAHRE